MWLHLKSKIPQLVNTLNNMPLVSISFVRLGSKSAFSDHCYQNLLLQSKYSVTGMSEFQVCNAKAKSLMSFMTSM